MIEPPHQLQTSAARSATPNMRFFDAKPLRASYRRAKTAIRSLCREMTATGCFTNARTPDLQIRLPRREAAGGSHDALAPEIHVLDVTFQSRVHDAPLANVNSPWHGSRGHCSGLAAAVPTKQTSSAAVDTTTVRMGRSANRLN